MKKLMFLVALLTSVLLVSCSNNVTEPVNADVNKPDMKYEFPYDYLQTFEEVKLMEWNLPTTDDDTDLRLMLDRNMEDMEDLFIVVFAADPTQDEEAEQHMFYVNQPGTKEIVISALQTDKPIKEVKAFARKITVLIDDTPPFEDQHIFRGVWSVWQTEGDQLVINTLPWTPDVLDVFAYVNKSGPDELIYLERPDLGKIVIPEYMVEEVYDVSIFVNSDHTMDK